MAKASLVGKKGLLLSVTKQHVSTLLQYSERDITGWMQYIVIRRVPFSMGWSHADRLKSREKKKTAEHIIINGMKERKVVVHTTLQSWKAL